jgi:hypothetical protein
MQVCFIGSTVQIHCGGGDLSLDHIFWGVSARAIIWAQGLPERVGRECFLFLIFLIKNN